MKQGDQVKTKDGKLGFIVEVLSRYIIVDTGNGYPRTYIKREVKPADA